MAGLASCCLKIRLEERKMADANSERAIKYIGRNCEYYAQGLPPTGEKYAVEYRGELLVSNDTHELRQQLQAIMDEEAK